MAKRPGKARVLQFKSFWGALAAFVLLQIFAFVVFQALVVFLTHYETYWYIGVLLTSVPLLALCVVVPFQSMVVRSIFRIVRGRERVAPRRALIGWALFLLFLVVWIYFLTGHYPFPHKESEWELVALYALIWIAALLAPVRVLEKFYRECDSFMVARRAGESMLILFVVSITTMVFGMSEIGSYHMDLIGGWTWFNLWTVFGIGYSVIANVYTFSEL